MGDVDPIVALTAKLDTLIAKVISIETLDRKFVEFEQKIEEMAVTIDQTYTLVNGRMTALISLTRQLAEAQEQVAVDKAEKRGSAQERKRAKHEKQSSDEALVT